MYDRGGIPVSVWNLDGRRLDVRDLNEEGVRASRAAGAGPDYLIPASRSMLVVTDPIRYRNLHGIQEAWYRGAVVPVDVVPGATVLDRS